MKLVFFRLNYGEFLDRSLQCGLCSGFLAPHPKRARTERAGEIGFDELAAPQPRRIREDASVGSAFRSPWRNCKNRRNGSAEPPSGAALPGGPEWARRAGLDRNGGRVRCGMPSRGAPRRAIPIQSPALARAARRSKSSRRAIAKHAANSGFSNALI